LKRRCLLHILSPMYLMIRYSKCGSKDSIA
jgi:hypothetical protein